MPATPATEQMDHRFLRPGHVIVSGDSVWLVDAERPAAVAIDPDGVSDVIAWPLPDRRDRLGRRIVVGDGVGIVVQDGATLTWVRREGCEQVRVEDVGLSAADSSRVWSVDNSHVVCGSPRPDGGWDPPPPLATVRAAVSDLLDSARLDTTDRRVVPSDDDDDLHGGDLRWVWLETRPDVIARRGLAAGGLVWWVGAPRHADAINRSVIVVGVDPGRRTQQVRLDLGVGIVVTAVPVDDELWLGILRGRFLRVSPDQGVEVCAIAADGTVRTVCEPDSIEIPVVSPALVELSDRQIAEHNAHAKKQFANLDRRWHNPRTGEVHPLSNGLSDPAARLEGDWPDTQLVITLRPWSRPGLVLRRRIDLYDETGHPVLLFDDDLQLMEDLDTGYLPPGEEAVDGILDI